MSQSRSSDLTRVIPGQNLTINPAQDQNKDQSEGGAEDFCTALLESKYLFHRFKNSQTETRAGRGDRTDTGPGQRSSCWLLVFLKMFRVELGQNQKNLLHSGTAGWKLKPFRTSPGLRTRISSPGGPSSAGPPGWC